MTDIEERVAELEQKVEQLSLTVISLVGADEPEPVSKAHWEQLDKADALIQELKERYPDCQTVVEPVCETCDGTGFIFHFGDDRPCPSCQPVVEPEHRDRWEVAMDRRMFFNGREVQPWEMIDLLVAHGITPDSKPTIDKERGRELLERYNDINGSYDLIDVAGDMRDWIAEVVGDEP